MTVCAVKYDEGEHMQLRPLPVHEALRETVKPLTVTIKGGCHLLGVGNTTMWALIKAQRVETIRIGRRRLILYSSLEKLLAASIELSR